MKVQMTITIELPDEYKEWSKDELAQLLSDEYVNHSTCAHFEYASDWFAKAKDDKSAKLIFEGHQFWGRICSAAKWTFEVLG